MFCLNVYFMRFVFSHFPNCLILFDKKIFPRNCVQVSRGLPRSPCLNEYSDVCAGCELMTLSESAIASDAPHLLLMLNPQAKVLSEDSVESASQLIGTVVGEVSPAASEARVDSSLDATAGGLGD
jgi:hypothetical protein